MIDSIVSGAHPRLSTRTGRILDASRALAALAVVVQHARLSLLVDPRSIATPNAASAALYWASGFGHQAVVVFFVLSGALVGGGVVTTVSDGTWRWSAYLIRRLSRLYIVLLPALLLVALWDSCGVALFPTSGVYRDVMSSLTIGAHTAIVHNRSLWALGGNAAFLMTIYVPVFGSAGALWSLSNEFWYYILFPCMTLAVIGRRNSWRTLGNVVFAAALLLFIGRELAEWLSVWLLGVAAVRMPRLRASRNRASHLVIASFAVFCVTTALERTLLNAVSLGGDLCVGAGFALFLYCVYCSDSIAPAAINPGRSATTWKALAGFSYTLYLFHQPPLTFANAWLVSVRHSRWQPTAPHVAAMVASIAVVVLYSYVGSRVTEAYTDSLRRGLTRLFVRSRKSPRDAGAPASAAVPS